MSSELPFFDQTWFNFLPLGTAKNDAFLLRGTSVVIMLALTSAQEQTSLYLGARLQHLLRSLPFASWRGGVSVLQGVGWRQSRACGNAPRLARTRPFAICSLGSYLMTLPHWTDARRGQQRRRPRSILRPTVSRSPAFVSASHSSTISLRRTLKSVSQTQGVGSYLRAGGLPKSKSDRFPELQQFSTFRPILV